MARAMRRRRRNQRQVSEQMLVPVMRQVDRLLADDDTFETGSRLDSAIAAVDAGQYRRARELLDDVLDEYDLRAVAALRDEIEDWPDRPVKTQRTRSVPGFWEENPTRRRRRNPGVFGWAAIGVAALALIGAVYVGRVFWRLTKL